MMPRELISGTHYEPLDLSVCVYEVAVNQKPCIQLLDRNVCAFLSCEGPDQSSRKCTPECL